MLKTLTKVYISQVFMHLLYGDIGGKDSKKFNGKKNLSRIFLMIFAFGILMVSAGVMFNTLCGVLVEQGLGWFYILLISLVSLLLGVLGSIFSTYSMVYQSKDNELLLSMPIPPSKVIFARVFGVYLVGTIYMCVPMLPGIAVYMYATGFAIQGIILSLTAAAFLSVLVLTLTCALGYVVALISSKLKTKKLVTVLLSLVLLAVFYWFYFRMVSNIETILENIAGVAEKVQNALYLFYLLGKGVEGDILSLLLFGAVVLAAFALVYWWMSRSFFGLATSNKGEKKKKFTLSSQKTSSTDSALLTKEFCRFKGSVSYMLNGGIGLVMLLAITVFAAIKLGDLEELILLLNDQYGEIVTVVVATLIMLIASTVSISAPSVSLEGKSIWLTRSLPVEPSRVLMAKLKLQLLPELPLVLALAVVLQLYTGRSWLSSVAVVAVSLCFAVFHGVIGLFFGIRMANYDWKNETVVIKQSMPVFISVIGGMAFPAVFCGLFFAVRSFLDAEVYMLLIFALMAVLTFFSLRWIMRSGAERFGTESL